MNGASITLSHGVGEIPTKWSIAAIGDYNGDGKSDLLWRDTLGNTSVHERRNRRVEHKRHRQHSYKVDLAVVEC
jgi:hypothetical protein